MRFAVRAQEEVAKVMRPNKAFHLTLTLVCMPHPHTSDPHPTCAALQVRFAVRAQEEVAKVLRPDRDDGSTLQMRIGKCGAV